VSLPLAPACFIRRPNHYGIIWLFGFGYLYGTICEYQERKETEAKLKRQEQIEAEQVRETDFESSQRNPLTFPQPHQESAVPAKSGLDTPRSLRLDSFPCCRLTLRVYFRRRFFRLACKVDLVSVGPAKITDARMVLGLSPAMPDAKSFFHGLRFLSGGGIAAAFVLIALG
jgi:hypothetical protein